MILHMDAQPLEKLSKHGVISPTLALEALNTPLERRRVTAGRIALPFTPQVAETKLNFCEAVPFRKEWMLIIWGSKCFLLPQRERKANKASLLISAVALPVLWESFIFHCWLTLSEANSAYELYWAHAVDGNATNVIRLWKKLCCLFDCDFIFITPDIVSRWQTFDKQHIPATNHPHKKRRCSDWYLKAQLMFVLFLMCHLGWYICFYTVVMMGNN